LIRSPSFGQRKPKMTNRNGSQAASKNWKPCRRFDSVPGHHKSDIYRHQPNRVGQCGGGFGNAGQHAVRSTMASAKAPPSTSIPSRQAISSTAPVSSTATLATNAVLAAA